MQIFLKTKCYCNKQSFLENKLTIKKKLNVMLYEMEP